MIPTRVLWSAAEALTLPFPREFFGDETTPIFDQTLRVIGRRRRLMRRAEVTDT